MKLEKLTCVVLVFFVVVINGCRENNMSPPDQQPLDTIPYIGDTTPFPYIYNYKTLLNQPLDTVRYYIDGKWRLEKTLGGWSGIRKYENTFVWFRLNALGTDFMQWYNDSTYFSNGPIVFTRQRVLFDTGTDTSYQIKYTLLPSGHPGWWFGFRANADSLLLVDNYTDGNYYFLTRAY